MTASQVTMGPVKIFGFGDKCDKCVNAKQKITSIFGLKIEEHSYEYHVTLHDGWKNDGSTDVMAARSDYGDDEVPLIQLPGEDHIRTYPSAMKELKAWKKDRKI